MKKEVITGLLSLTTYFILSRFFSVSGIISGFLLGFSLCALCLGLLPQNAREAIKAAKQKVFHLSYSNSNE